MDLPSFLALIVAALIVLSGYFLFNDAPSLGRTGNRRRAEHGRRRCRVCSLTSASSGSSGAVTYSAAWGAAFGTSSDCWRAHRPLPPGA